MTKECTYKSFQKHPFYTEGPAMDIAGNWYFTNLSGGQIICIRKDGVQSTWANTACPNGQVIRSNGQHLVCDSKKGSVILFDQNGNFIKTVIDQCCAGEVISVPNDIIEDKNGNIYFTDSVRHDGKIGSIRCTGKEVIVARGLDYPNGLALSKDETKLFVAESYKNRIIGFDFNDEGEIIKEYRVIANLPCHPSNNIINNLPDGIKVDSDDSIWVAHYGMGMIHRVNGNGEILQSLNIPFNLVSNLFIQNQRILVTGGYGEPGPGGIVEIEL